MSELRETLTTLGEEMTREDVDEMINDADTNGDGKIDYEGQSDMTSSDRQRMDHMVSPWGAVVDQGWVSPPADSRAVYAEI